MIIAMKEESGCRDNRLVYFYHPFLISNNFSCQ